MRPKHLRDLGDAELAQKEHDLREEAFRLRLKRATGQLENRMQVRLVRKDLARALTVLRERTAKAGTPGAGNA